MLDKEKLRLGILMIVSIIFIGYINISYASVGQGLKLVLNNEDISDKVKPIIENDRTLVPVRFISESLGANVTWDSDNQTVYIKKGKKSVFLRINSRLIDYNDGMRYELSDIPSKIINEKTYVPIRVVSNALGIDINWINDSRTILMNSNDDSNIEEFYNFKIINLYANSEINTKTDIKVDFDKKYNDRVNNIKLLLLDKDTGKGFIVARNSGLNKTLSYLPKVEENGEKILVAAIYDDNNDFISGKALKVKINVIPKVSLDGIQNNQVIKEKISIKPNINFLPAYVDYIIENSQGEEVNKVSNRDPFESYVFNFNSLKNGNYLVRLKAYDKNEKYYFSNSYPVEISIDNNLKLGGVREGMSITKSVNLIAVRNFDVVSTTYLIKDGNSGIEKVLKTIPYGSYKWMPSNEDNGEKYLKVRVEDTLGKTHDSEYVKVNVDLSPYISVKGIGPKQVLTGAVDLTVDSNVNINKIQYKLKNKDNNETKNINIDDQTGKYNLSVLNEESGEYSIKAIAYYNGTVLESNEINFKIYKGEIFHSRPIVEKDKFLDFASELAVDSYQKTDMSAALQTAQAILETGWGQSVPVDKYSNKFSYNLFGIKGSSTNGSVISNTWEVYNGKYYRVDDYFRAYNTSLESWKDHKSLLLKASRYQIFRDVMYDSSLGAWSIRRAGYATDPKYPVKLIRIIKQYNLRELDKIGI